MRFEKAEEDLSTSSFFWFDSPSSKTYVVIWIRSCTRRAGRNQYWDLRTLSYFCTELKKVSHWKILPLDILEELLRVCRLEYWFFSAFESGWMLFETMTTFFEDRRVYKTTSSPNKFSVTSLSIPYDLGTQYLADESTRKWVLFKFYISYRRLCSNRFRNLKSMNTSICYFLNTHSSLIKVRGCCLGKRWKQWSCNIL